MALLDPVVMKRHYRDYWDYQYSDNILAAVERGAGCSGCRNGAPDNEFPSCACPIAMGAFLDEGSAIPEWFEVEQPSEDNDGNGRIGCRAFTPRNQEQLPTDDDEEN